MTATTGTISNRIESVFGDKRVVRLDFVLGTYASNGVGLSPADVGLTTFDIVLIAPSGGYEYSYNSSTQKVLAFRQPTLTFSGVVSAPVTVSMSNITVTGPAAATGAALALTADSNAGIIGKASATTRTIPVGTFGIPVPTATMAPVFTGSATTQAKLAEATGTPTLSTATRILIIGT